ncbi:MAG: branched chain amino acid aminotransferase [Deltaproteobacteria bacterium]|mgnify:CR=1 FL=1|nr:MAG: branched chain amino acid aminotransferase [Deltaproteobacteria bacterium]
MERANLDFANLPFAFQDTDKNIRYYFKDKKWSEGELTSDTTVTISMASTCLHYGQEIFEGLKAYERADGKIQLFRIEENAKRLQRSAKKLLMEPVPIELFREAVHRVVKANARFVPPFGSGASLYIRPLEIGISAEVGVKPSNEYLFMIFVTPVGPYYKEGLTPVKLRVEEVIHRAAPGGVGDIKCGGNYAAGMRATIGAKAEGFSEVLYLDSKESNFIDESGSSNFFAIKGNKFITPESESILPSITRLSVVRIAEDMGMEVEQRPVSLNELPDFDEAGCLGTAAVITPVESVTYRDEVFTYAKDGKVGPKVLDLYNRLTAIQLGEAEDPYGWTEVVE